MGSWFRRFFVGKKLKKANPAGPVVTKVKIETQTDVSTSSPDLVAASLRNRWDRRRASGCPSPPSDLRRGSLTSVSTPGLSVANTSSHYQSTLPTPGGSQTTPALIHRKRRASHPPAPIHVPNPNKTRPVATDRNSVSFPRSSLSSQYVDAPLAARPTNLSPIPQSPPEEVAAVPVKKTPPTHNKRDGDRKGKRRAGVFRSPSPNSASSEDIGEDRIMDMLTSTPEFGRRAYTCRQHNHDPKPNPPFVLQPSDRPGPSLDSPQIHQPSLPVQHHPQSYHDSIHHISIQPAQDAASAIDHITSNLSVPSIHPIELDAFPKICFGTIEASKDLTPPQSQHSDVGLIKESPHLQSHSEQQSAEETDPGLRPYPGHFPLTPFNALAEEGLDAFDPSRKPVIYSVKALLGAGAFGRVVLATRQDTLDLVAVKVVKRNQGRPADMVNQLLRLEVNIMKTIADTEKAKAQMLMPLHTAWITRDEAYFVMPAVKHSLEDYFKYIAVNRHDPADGLTKIVIAAELIEAVSQLHGLNIVHRDIKPANILFAYDNHLVLSDFGCSHKFEERLDEYRLKDWCGTNGYMAPEIVMLDPNHPSSDRYWLYSAEKYSHCYSSAVDIFSCGAVIYELMTGTPAYMEVEAMEPNSGGCFKLIGMDSAVTGVGSLCHKMIAPYPSDRPNIEELKKASVFEYLLEISQLPGEI
ncbi:kinase-like domain-containing protein [Abortiporus biennis]|nr:kinase-like domain-containing protein [Abortiporus biennis]